MNEDRSLERAARSWIEVGPTRAPEPAIAAALARIRSTPQDRVFLAPWRFVRMSLPVRIAALLVVGALILAGVALLAGGAPGPEPSPGPTATPAQTAGASATVPPGAATTFTTTVEPRLAIDLPPGWTALELGGEIRLSYLAPNFTSSSVRLVRLDRARIIEPGAGPAPIPDDLLGWLGEHEYVSVTSRTTVSIAGRDVPALWAMGVRGSEEEPFREYALMSTGADRELFVATALPAWFAVIDGLATGVLVHLHDANPVSVEQAVSVLQTLRDAAP